jgi:hypothetical protein
VAQAACQRKPRPRPPDAELVAAEASERLELLVSGAENASERAENIALLRRCLPEAESAVASATPAGRRRAVRELAVLRSVLESVDRGAIGDGLASGQGDDS